MQRLRVMLHAHNRKYSSQVIVSFQFHFNSINAELFDPVLAHPLYRLLVRYYSTGGAARRLLRKTILCAHSLVVRYITNAESGSVLKTSRISVIFCKYLNIQNTLK